MGNLVFWGIVAGYLYMAKSTFEKCVLRSEANHKKRWGGLDTREYRGEFVMTGVLAAFFWFLYRPYIAFVQESKNGYIERVFAKNKEPK